MSVKFIHRRYVVEPTEADKKAGKSFSLSCKGGITVGYRFDEATKLVKLAVARCAMTENFNRRIARDIVLGRLECKRQDPPRNHIIDMSAVTTPTPQGLEDIVWGWLENRERFWDAEQTPDTPVQ